MKRNTTEKIYIIDILPYSTEKEEKILTRAGSSQEAMNHAARFVIDSEVRKIREIRPEYDSFDKALKIYAAGALDVCFGFAPAFQRIRILNAHFDERQEIQWVEFEVGGHIYSFDGITVQQERR